MVLQHVGLVKNDPVPVDVFQRASPGFPTVPRKLASLETIPYVVTPISWRQWLAGGLFGTGRGGGIRRHGSTPDVLLCLSDPLAHQRYGHDNQGVAVRIVWRGTAMISARETTVFPGPSRHKETPGRVLPRKAKIAQSTGKQRRLLAYLDPQSLVFALHVHAETQGALLVRSKLHGQIIVHVEVLWRRFPVVNRSKRSIML